MVTKYEFTGKEKGINLLILAAVHGNETAGTNALNRFIEEINSGKYELLKGNLTVVPICNEKAYEKDVRQIEENLNRVMKVHDNPVTYEQKIANDICPLIEKADVMLDLHSTHCKGDVPFAFCDYPNDKNYNLVANLPVEFVLEEWPEIYDNQADIDNYCTEKYAYSCGTIGATLECGYHKSVNAIEIAYQAILNTLINFGMITGEKILAQTQKHILLKSYVTKKKEGKLLKAYKHLDFVKKGENIAQYDDGEILTSPSDGYILLPNDCAEIGAEWYYLGEYVA